jgi:hypothetical protein
MNSIASRNWSRLILRQTADPKTTFQCAINEPFQRHIALLLGFFQIDAS